MTVLDNLHFPEGWNASLQVPTPSPGSLQALRKLVPIYLPNSTACPSTPNPQGSQRTPLQILALFAWNSLPGTQGQGPA